MPDLIKPPMLRPGDTVALVSPSWGAAAEHEIRFGHAIAAFQRIFDLNVKVMPHALGLRGYTSGTREQRLSDIHDAFADPTIAAVVSIIAGRHSAQLLEDLDYDLIKANPKMFCGYSDITSINHAIYAQTNLVTFSAPMIMTQWGEWTRPDPHTVDWFRRAVMRAEPVGEIVGSPTYTDERVSWARPRNRERARRPARPYAALRPGVAEGPLLAGTLTNFCELLGTPFEPDFRDAILVLDTPGHGFGPGEGDQQLWHLRNAGVFDDVAAVVLGRPYHFDDAQTDQLHQVLLDVTEDFRLPVLANVDYGHTDPVATLPLGIRARVDDSRLFLLESAVTA
ncbi:S66 peptidase family protein [Actinoplanes sp. NPDC051475]|uniref:S66 peptidase family protein n=1 Tax=Actinoplanes sp. NPDC051475 TaxID=3157225 RepID=UPI00344E9B9B